MIKNRFLNIFETSSLFCQLWEGDFLPGSSLGFLIPAGLFLSSPCWEPFISGAHIEMAGWNPGSRNCVAEEDFSHFQVFSASLEMLRHKILAQPTVVQQQLGWLWAWYHIFTYHSCLIWRCEPVQGHHPWIEQVPTLLDALRRLSPAFCQLFL